MEDSEVQLHAQGEQIERYKAELTAALPELEAAHKAATEALTAAMPAADGSAADEVKDLIRGLRTGADEYQLRQPMRPLAYAAL